MAKRREWETVFKKDIREILDDQSILIQNVVSGVNLSKGGEKGEQGKGDGNGQGNRLVISLFGHQGCEKYFKRIERLSYGRKVIGGGDGEVFRAGRPMAE